MRSPLYPQLVTSSATIKPYCGVETAAHFPSGATAEFHQLTSGLAVYDLGWRAKIAVSGDDRARWLNGMLTNNIRDLKPGHGNYNFLLNAKGHILGDLYAYNRGDSIWLDTEHSQAANLTTILDKFIIMDDVELTDISANISGIALQGSCARTTLGKLGVAVPDLEPMQFVDLEWNGAGITLTRMEAPDFETYEVWGTAETLAALWQALLANGASPVGTDALELFRVMIGVPKFGDDIRETDLPQETGQDHALNFTKGCYIGQEIVERIRSRGAVRRRFTGFLVSAGQATAGTKLYSDGKEVGILTSIALAPSRDLGEQVLALGYIRQEALERHAPITFEGGVARPHSLPFAKQ